MNIFRLFQRWKHKGGNGAKNVPRVLPSTTSTSTGTLEEMENNDPANDVAHQAAIPRADHSNAVGSQMARWIGPGMSVTVAGRNIGGMIYLNQSQGEMHRVIG